MDWNLSVGQTFSLRWASASQLKAEPVTRRGFAILMVPMIYRIGIATVLAAAFLGAAPQSAKRPDSPDMKEIRDYRLSMDNIQKFVAALKVISKDEAVKKCGAANNAGNATTLDLGQKQLESCPAAVADLTAQGLKPREFLLLTANVMGDFMAVGMKRTGQIKEYPSSISPENAAFVEQNFDKLKSMIEPLMNGGGK
jgi:hypothetical protein